jgi:hypothetical protein
MRALIVAVCFFALPAHAGEIVTCTGKLLGTKTHAVVVDSSGRTCTVDIRGSGHDPMKTCEVGGPCRVTGTARRSASGTYAIDQIIEVNPPP